MHSSTDLPRRERSEDRNRRKAKMRGKAGHRGAGEPPSKSRASRWDKDAGDPKLNTAATTPPADDGTEPSSQNELARSPKETLAGAAEPAESFKPSVEPHARESAPPKVVAEAQAVGPFVEAFARPSAVAVDPRAGPALLGFGMLEKRSITLGDGSVRTYYALPPDPSQPLPAGNNAVINPSFDSANLGSRDSIVALYGQDNQYNAPENPHHQNSNWPARGLQPNEAEYLARKAEENRFYSANPMAPPQSNSLGLEKFGRREGASVEGSIPRDSYGNAGVISSVSAEVGNDAGFFPGDPAAAGLRAQGTPSAEDYRYGKFPTAAVGLSVQGLRSPLSPRRSQLSPQAGSRLSRQEIEYYGSAENPLKRKYVEEEGMRDGLQRGLVDERDYLRRVREMELLEERRWREQGRADFVSGKYLEDEALRQHVMYSSSSRPVHYENPHGGGGVSSRLPPNDRSDLIQGSPAEPWVSSSRFGTTSPSSWGRQALHYKNDLVREMEDERNYQRPSKYQKQNDDQQRTWTGHRTDDDAPPNDRAPVRQSGVPEDSEEFKQQVHIAYLRFAKALNENPGQRKRYQDEGKSGSLLCLVCSRRSEDYADTHSLVLHAYNSQDSGLRAQHLGLHKALCVLMGWSYASPPDDERSYQSLPTSEAMANREDLILVPPVVIIHNAYTMKRKDGRWEGIGNKDMDGQLKELGFSSGKSKALYGRDGRHQGSVVVKFSPNVSGFQEADRLVKYFEVNNHGRKDWLRVQSSDTAQQNDDENPDLIQIDEKTKAKKRVLYGYLATAGDLEKVDFDTRKKATVKSRKDIDSLADGPVEE